LGDAPSCICDCDGGSKRRTLPFRKGLKQGIFGSEHSLPLMLNMGSYTFKSITHTLPPFRKGEKGMLQSRSK
jgi:hypothetical protein